MKSVYRLRIFAACEISHPAKFRNLRIFIGCENFHNLRIFAGCENFHNLRNSQANSNPPPRLEHLQQHKTKNFEKLSLKNKLIHKNLEIKGY